METDIQEIQLACFRLGDATFAADIMRIKEIIRPQKLTKIPKAPAFVEGVINLRGMVIPVIDLRKRFELPERVALEEARLLVVGVSRQLVGLVVDDVTEVVTVQVGDIKPPPHSIDGVSAEYLIGVCLVRDTLVMLVNLDRILTSREASAIAGLAGTGR
ncbi:MULTISPECIES: chemotaxis protein CheW [Geobacter]|uniref:chemotaxis protein CheW n=1 Tax=Geobacter TaxID=28231 RepID=UPI002572DB6A|nr:chemotaxis protein CheW [Geobacter sulfurreducens]BEH09798.1 chemotaxis protein CheW [Geobacter sulfurreducens subsp. ethanolicus]BET57693.1 chemotaxis protein CheW [Geobacter sp. 60473]HML78921.1 chemotaxis protein CheW [Geobacter sulfurreducens]